MLLAMAAAAVATAFAAPRMPTRPPLHVPREESAIRKSLAESPHAGDCEQCHTTHGDDQPTVYPNALVGPDDNALCLRCHSTAWSGGSFGGDALYRGTGHGSGTSMIWPGPTPPMRLEIDAATKCLNCHDPHGMSDSHGAIPMLGLQREETACLTCHDGSPAHTNIASELNKPYRHPVGTISDRHSGPQESQPSDFAVSPVNQRHAECEDCHNPHVSRADNVTVEGTSDASKVTLGVSRVSVLNGAAGTVPAYTFIAGADTLTAPVAEYQLCFKCHSSWTTQPSGQTDFGKVLNTSNPSYHPVEGAGANASIASGAFAAGWSAASVTRCGSCHGTDFGTVAGPHGSNNQYLLRAPYSTSSATRTMDSGDLCFSCHNFDTYANHDASSTVQGYSRFNLPNTEMGHAKHVGDQNIPCAACHTTHGSTTLPFLLVTGRTPGIGSYTKTSTGGTCTPTCHGTKTYTINYAR